MRPKLVSSPVEKRREGRIKKIKERVVKMQVNFNDEYDVNVFKKEVENATKFIIWLAENHRFSELKEYYGWYSVYFYNRLTPSELNVPELPLPETIDSYGEENVGDVYIVDIDDETWEVTITVEKGRE